MSYNVYESKDGLTIKVTKDKDMKKILVILLIIIIMVHPIAFADDGTMVDDKLQLTYNIYPVSNEGTIGEYFEYTISFKNNSSKTITLDRVNSSFGDIPSEQVEQCEIKGGNKLRLKVRQQIPYEVRWHREGSEFYANLYLWLSFSIKDYYADYDQPAEFVDYQYEPIPIKLTNIQDGAELVDMNIDEKENTFVYEYIFSGKTSSGKSNTYTSSFLGNFVSCKNISNKILDDFYFHSSHSENKTIKPNQKLKYTQYAYNHVRTDEKLPTTQKANYNVTFTVDGKYYGVSEVRIYKCIYLPYKLDVDIDIKRFEKGYKSIDEEYGNYLVTITNKGDKIKGLYVGLNQTFNTFDKIEINTSNIIGQLSNGESAKLYLYHKNSEDILVSLGIIANNAVYEIGEYSFSDYSNSGNKNTYISGYGGGGAVDFSLMPYKSATPIPEFTPTPTQKLVATPLETTPSPVIITPEPIIMPTPVTQRPVYVEIIEEKTIIPVWVYPVLGLVVIETIVLILFLRKKSNETK